MNMYSIRKIKEYNINTSDFSVRLIFSIDCKVSSLNIWKGNMLYNVTGSVFININSLTLKILNV